MPPEPHICGSPLKFDQTGSVGRTRWIRPGETQSLAQNKDAADVQKLVFRTLTDLFSARTAMSTSRPCGLPLVILLDNGYPSSSETLRKARNDDVERLRRRLWVRLEEEPLEDGITHPAENLVREALLGSPNGRLGLYDLVVDDDRPEFSSAVLRLAGRVGRSAENEWRRDLVKSALTASSHALREAAVEAVEQWEDPKLVSLLREHEEPVPWLKDYIDDVIDDLSE